MPNMASLQELEPRGFRMSLQHAKGLNNGRETSQRTIRLAGTVSFPNAACEVKDEEIIYEVNTAMTLVDCSMLLFWFQTGSVDCSRGERSCIIMLLRDAISSSPRCSRDTVPADTKQNQLQSLFLRSTFADLTQPVV
ncbi:hypothetical protein F2P81_022659 [Scophthalmus maximus]|uniref:Uncharacterized protein n=1 Tax=Scophthalmus maximus TaxID=52904 RepID=A0A6A4S0W7_SCOMX|nr:hypothetical protein F2P81_022659 [Scophthalmus maximus]